MSHKWWFDSLLMTSMKIVPRRTHPTKAWDALARDDERKNAEHFGSAEYNLAEAFKTMDVILLNTKETSLNTQ